MHDDDADRVLLDGWLAGDRRAGDRLIQRYFQELRGFFITAVGDQDALDLLQDTFRRLMTAVHRFEGRSSFRTYLYSIARIAKLDLLRSRNTKGAELDPLTHSVEDVEGMSPSSVVLMVERSKAINQCVRRLPIALQETLHLFYWQGMSGPALAEIYGIPEATVRTRLLRARQMLRRCLGEDMGETLRGQADATEAADEPLDDLEDRLKTLGRELLGVGPG